MSGTSSSASSSPVRHTKSSRRPRKDPQTPQQKIDEFWTKYKTKAPGRVTSIIPQNELAERAARRASAKCAAPAKTTEQSYTAAVEQCQRKVAQIVRECRRVNQRYRDPHFDLEIDQKLSRRDCLDSLDNERDGYYHGGYWYGPRDPRGGRSGRRRRRTLPHKDREAEASGGGGGPTAEGGRGLKKSMAAAGSILGLLDAVDQEMASALPDGDGDSEFRPLAVKRVVDIFDEPQFFIDGPTANDVRQGRDGDCWLMAALCTISNKPGLIERCCIAHDQEVGVYGFVFHRDGEWFSEIIDDKLYLTKPDYDESRVERVLWDDRERVNSEEAYRKIYQSNSGSLYFAQCEHPQETWLPLLEKAYAKAHGDYSAIEGGYGGEGIEDLSGGVTSEIYTTDILDKERFWNEELMKVNQDFLFGCSTGVWGRGWGERKGIVELHAYSVLKAREIDGVRLVLLKNPWGKHEWRGAWSDGSKEWTAEWLQKLDHKFGDDGSFWISYDDLLRKYQAFDRTRLFGPEWKVASIWTTLDIPWTLDYHDTKFAFSLARSGPVVIVFAQLDERYFKGLEGQYRFELSFRVHQRAASNGAESADDYVVRSQNYYRMNRSVNVELDLAAGEYVVVVKVDAQRNERLMPVEEVVRAHAKDRREKLLRIGLAYDVAHSKGKIAESAEEKEARAAYDKRRTERERRRVANIIRENRRAARQAQLRAKHKERQAREKAEARARAKADRRAARRAARAKAGEQEREKEEEKEEDETKGESGEGEDVEGKGDEDKEREGERTDEKAPRSGGTSVVEVVDDKKGREDASTRNATDEKDVTADTTAEADMQAEGSISSTENGEQTPASSAASTKNPAEVDEALDGEEYVTATEDEEYATAAEEETMGKPSQESTNKQSAPSAEEGPSTPKPVQIPASAPKTNETSTPGRVDVGVQTGPQLPFPPQPSTIRIGPPSPHHHPHHHQNRPQGLYMPPQPGRYGPPREMILVPGDMSRMPPELRGPYIQRMGPPPPPPPRSESVMSISGSESSDASEDAADDDDDEVSDDEIDRYLADQRAHAARQAAAQAAAKAQAEAGRSGGSSGPPAKEEPLDEFEKDPWNAVGVFGLRVYYRVLDAAAGVEKGGDGEEIEEEEGVRLRVERPNHFLWDESSDEEDADDEAEGDKGDKGEKEESKMLDVDDSAKDAVGEQATAPGPEDREAQTKKEEETTEVKKQLQESTSEDVKTEQEPSEKQPADVDAKKEGDE